jgi:hypothetical protein
METKQGRKRGVVADKKSKIFSSKNNRGKRGQQGEPM